MTYVHNVHLKIDWCRLVGYKPPGDLASALAIIKAIGAPNLKLALSTGLLLAQVGTHQI